MRTLTLSTDTFDRVNTFNVKLDGPYARRCSLHRGYQSSDDGVLWIMQRCGVLASSYSPAELAERERLNASIPVTHGERVLVDGKEYIVRVLGDYSDCAILDPVPPSVTDGMRGRVWDDAMAQIEALALAKLAGK